MSGSSLHGPLGSHSPEEGCRAALFASHPHEGSSAGQQHTGLPRHPLHMNTLWLEWRPGPRPSSCHVGGCLVRGRSPEMSWVPPGGPSSPRQHLLHPAPQENGTVKKAIAQMTRACCCPWLPGASFRSWVEKLRSPPWTKGPGSLKAKPPLLRRTSLRQLRPWCWPSS